MSLPHAFPPSAFRENLPGHFKFKEYCPQVFRNLRERFGIEDLDYQVRAAEYESMMSLMLRRHFLWDEMVHSQLIKIRFS